MIDSKSLSARPNRSYLRKGLFLFTLTLGLLPLYLWSSGLPQVGHIVGAVWVGWTLFHGYWAAPRLVIWGMLFAFYAGVVNLVLYLFYGDVHSLLSASYYFYNTGLVGALVGTARRFGFESTLRVVFWVFLGWLLLEAILVVAGVGRVYGGFRVMGTFNDPNQFAHWVLWAVIAVVASGYYLYRTIVWGWVAFAVGLLLLVLSASRSGLLGMVVVGLGLLSGVATPLLQGLVIGRWKRLRPGALAVAAILFLSAAGGLLNADLRNEFHTQAEKFAQRVLEGVVKGEKNLEERGYDRLWKFPEYLLLGAGEGANLRWAGKTSFLGEIHSTPAGVVFYYGVPGTLLFLGLLWSVWSTLPVWWLRVFLLAPLFYGLGTYNLRNSMFWIGLGILYIAGLALKSKRSGVNSAANKG